MKLFLLTLVLTLWLTVPVRGVEYTAPEVPDSGQSLMPESNTFADGLGEMLHKAITMVSPYFHSAVGLGSGCIGCVLLVSLSQTLWDGGRKATQWVGVTAIAAMLLNQAGSMIRLGSETVMEISQYGKLLLPVMTAALAAQGGVGTSGALYLGTSLFGSVLSSLFSHILVPAVYVYLALSVTTAAIDDGTLKNIRDTIRSAYSWCLKTLLTVFTTYMTITGVVSGTTDAAALKATKVTISAMVPMVGSILSDASEAVLVSAGLAKNAAGIYGIFSILAVFLLPFLRIGVQYLVLEVSAVICSVFDCKQITGLISDFSSAMGMLLAMTGSACLLQLISTVCFLKGVGV